MGKFINEINNRHGRLLVIERAETPKEKSGVWWKCKCDCGNIITALGTSLRSGNTKSCGCLQKEIASSSTINEIGNKYGFLTVISRAESRKGRKTAFWNCKCECGNSTVVEGVKLRSGHTRSCGKCHPFESSKIDEVGNRYDRLLVLEEYGRTCDGKVLWKCLCDCGNEKIATGKSLRAGLTKSCGCLHSLGEEKIQQILVELNISFERQKTFEDCRNPKTGYKLYFDFFLPDYNLIIEYQGEQHYFDSPRGYFSKTKIEELCERDKIKKEYCKNKQINFIEIPYYDFNKLNKEYIKEVVL